MNRPLVAVVFAYAAGLLLAQWFQPPLAALFGFTFLVLVLEKARPFFIWPLLALVGWTNFAARTAVVSPNDLRTLLSHEPAIVTIQGTLAETPRLKIVERDEVEKWRSVVRVHVREMRRGSNFLPADGEILVTTPDLLSCKFLRRTIRGNFRRHRATRRRRWPKGFSIFKNIWPRAAFFTSSKPSPPTTGKYSIRVCQHRRSPTAF